ncbi:MAG TPA: hypothetical protein VFV33_25500, partial [Gemmatimonadaceae bacterium]|nr:hypothetical protein [Gemmatimonadaceae bacterium]
MLRATEPVRVGVRAPANASVWLALDTTVAGRRMLLSGATLPGARATGRDSTALPRDSVARLLGAPESWATDVPASALASPTSVVVARGADTVRLAVPPVALSDTAIRLVILGADPTPVADTDRVIIGRPQPDATYKWYLLPGTRVELTGRSSDFARVRL